MWLNFAGEMYMEMNGVKEICVLGFLGINSWIDIRKKQVSLPADHNICSLRNCVGNI